MSVWRHALLFIAPFPEKIDTGYRVEARLLARLYMNAGLSLVLSTRPYYSFSKKIVFQHQLMRWRAVS